MSLINQALKLEQQRRHQSNHPVAPMVTRLTRERHQQKWPLVLVGFTCMGLLLAGSITAIYHFGSGFLDERGATASLAAEPSEQAIPGTAEARQPSAEQVLAALSAEELDAFKQLLSSRTSDASPRAAAPKPIENTPAPSTNPPQKEVLAELAAMQNIVDAFQVQGIRKAGKATRVFMDGKVRYLGEIVHLESQIKLIGFTENELIFSSTKGDRFRKSL